jgi:hypothetical protein
VKDGTRSRNLSFGSRFLGGERISALLNDFTFPTLWGRLSQQYNEGLDVSFGDFRVSKQGIKISMLGMSAPKKPISWADVQSYCVVKGTFTLVYTSAGKTYTAKRAVAEIANFRVMLTLLQHIKPQPVAGGRV